MVDAVDPVVVESAAALARHLRQGRDRRLAVLEWFAETGMLPVQPGAVPVPEPPIGAVRQALLWVLERSVSHRLVEAARTGAGEEGQDALYALAGKLTGRYRGSPHPALVRAALEAGEDLPVEAEGPGFRGMVHLVTAIGLGVQEVGADALAEAFAAIGMYGLTVEDWAQMLGAAERDEAPPVDWGLLERHTDAVGRVKRASDEKLVRAPDGADRPKRVLLPVRAPRAAPAGHPGTGRAAAADRQPRHVPDPGPRHHHHPPGQFAVGLTVCLEPFFDNLYEVLLEQLMQGPDIFRIPGDDSGEAGFGETWIRTLREPTNGGRRRRRRPGE